MCVNLPFQLRASLIHAFSFLREGTGSSPLESSSAPSMISTANAKTTCGQRCPVMASRNSPSSFGRRSFRDNLMLKGSPSPPFQSILAKFTLVSPFASPDSRHSPHPLRGCPYADSAVVPATHLPFPHCTVRVCSGRERCLHQFVRGCGKEDQGRA